jgi:hypothetical protein
METLVMISVVFLYMVDSGSVYNPPVYKKISESRLNRWTNFKT